MLYASTYKQIVIKICKFKKYLHIIKQFWLKLFNNIINPFKVQFNSINFNIKA